MEILKEIVLFFHLLFMAALIGGYFVAATQRGVVNKVMQWGARLQLVAGIILYGVVMAAESSGGPQVSHMILGIKALVGIAVVALIEVAAGAQERAQEVPGPGAREHGSVPTPSLRGKAPHAGAVNAAGALAILNLILGIVS